MLLGRDIKHPLNIHNVEGRSYMILPSSRRVIDITPSNWLFCPKGDIFSDF